MLNTATAGYSSDDVASVPRQTETRSELNSLEVACERLKQRVNQLRDRLSPLVSNVPTPIDAKGGTEKSHLVPFAMEINVSRNDIEQSIRELDYILDNIQI